MQAHTMKKEHWRRLPVSFLILALIALLLAFAFFFVRALELTSVHRLAELIVGWGVWGPLALILLTIVAALTGIIPSTPLAILAGAIWGTYWGALFVVIGVQIGAILAFLIARHAAFPWIDALLKKHLNLYTQISDKYIARFIFVSRLFPIFVFEIISYAAGLTRITFWHYFWATLLGIIPMTFLLTWSADLAVTEGGPLLWISTTIALILLFAFPWVVEKYNPFNIKERLLTTK